MNTNHTYPALISSIALLSFSLNAEAGEPFRLQAHSGLSNRYPENTILAFSEAGAVSDYLEICRRTGLIPYVELKKLQGDGARRTIEMLESYNLPQDYVVTSFNLGYLREAARYTSVPLEYMCKKFTKAEVDDCAGLPNVVVRPNAVRIDDELVEYCRSKGLRMECYGIPVGDKALVKRLKAWGIEGGTCNDWEGLGLKKRDFRQ